MLKILLHFCFIVLILGKNETEFGEKNEIDSGEYGKTAEPGEHPYAVYIPEALCAGTLVTLNTVISAAHCFHGKSFEGWEVLAGVLNLKEKSSAQTKNIKSVLLHPDFRTKPADLSVIRYYHDIAKVTLDSPFEQNKEVGPAQIFSASEDEFKKDWLYNVLDNYVPCYTMGWNCNDGKCEGKDSGVLKTARLRNYPHNIKCVNINPRGEEPMCEKGEVVVHANGKWDDIEKNNVFTGDPGGPLVCGGLAYGVNAKSLDKEYKDRMESDFYCVLFWPYLELFGSWTLRSHSSALFQHHLLLLILTTFISSFS